MNLLGFEARQFAHLDPFAVVFGDNRTATRGSEVNRKIICGKHHFVRFYLYQFLAKVVK